MQVLGLVFNKMSTIFVIIVILFSVILHEVAHGYSAYWLGDPTAKMAGRLTLNPISHIDPIGSIILPAMLSFLGLPVIGWAKPVPFNPYNLRAGKWGPALVAIAGPLANITVAVFFSALIRLNGVYFAAPVTFISLSLAIVELNLFLAVFNLVPIPPLDGSKVLFALLPYRLRHIEQALERYGLMLVLFFVMFGANFIIPIENFLVKLLTGL